MNKIKIFSVIIAFLAIFTISCSESEQGPEKSITDQTVKKDFSYSAAEHEKLNLDLEKRKEWSLWLQKHTDFTFTVKELEKTNLNDLDNFFSNATNISSFTTTEESLNSQSATLLTTETYEEHWPDLIFKNGSQMFYLRSEPGGCSNGRKMFFYSKWVIIPNASGGPFIFANAPNNGGQFPMLKGPEQLQSLLDLNDKDTEFLWGKSCLCEDNDYIDPPISCTDAGSN